MFDKGGGVEHFQNMHIGRQGGFEFFQTFLHPGGHGHGVGPRLFHNHHAQTRLAVGAFGNGNVFDGVFNGGHVLDVDVAAAHAAHHQVFDIVAFFKAAFHPELIVGAAHAHTPARHVDIGGGNHVAEVLDGKVIGIQLLGIGVDIHHPFGRTAEKHGGNAVHPVKRINHLVVYKFFQAAIRLIGRNGIKHDGHHAGAELEDGGAVAVVGQVVNYHIQRVAYVGHRHIKVGAPFKFQRHNRQVVFGRGGNLFELIDGGKLVFDNFGNVFLNIGGIGAGIDRHHRYARQFHIGIEVDGNFGERI